ncbi:MAG: alpha-galactosidase [Lentisphaeria bacterium]
MKTSSIDHQAMASRWLGTTAEPPPFFCTLDGAPVGERLDRAGVTCGPEQAAAGAVCRSVHWPAPAAGLDCRCELRTFERHAAVEWTLHLRNPAAQPSPVLAEVQALDLSLEPELDEPVLHYARGAVCCLDDFQPVRRVLNRGAAVDLQPGGGRSSSDFLPYFNLQLGAGQGVIFGIGWAGEWRARFDRGTDGRVRVRIGQAYCRLRLLPGEEIRTPLVLVLPYRGALADGQNALRRFIMEHHRPRANGAPLELGVYSGNWGGTAITDHQANVTALVAHDVPVDTYWIDAEWFGKGPWYRTVGDWRPKANLYPAGFRPLADQLHAAGHQFLLWFEPERVCPGTPWAAEHAEWLLGLSQERRCYNWGTSQQEPDWTRWESRRNQITDGDRLLNLGLPEACRFLTDTIAGFIEAYGVDCYRHDANIAPLEFWRQADPPDREGITEIRWVEGLYAYWDGLLARFPHLMIDNCASGGRRLDLETISRGTPLWRTDCPGNAIGRQCHTHGLAAWVPLNATGAVNAGRDTAYAMRSAWSSGLVTGLFAVGDTAQGGPPPPDFPYAQATAALNQYRQAKRFFLGDYYPLSAYSQADDAWMAWQFHLPAAGEGMVQAFRRDRSPHAEAAYPLAGLDAAATYEVTDLDSGTVRRFSGRDLMTAGLPVRIPERPAAAVLFYRCVNAP